MFGSGISRWTTAGVAVTVVAAGLLAAVPAHADVVGGPGWVTREDGTTPGTDTTYTWSGADGDLHLSSFNGQVAVFGTSASGVTFDAGFVPPAGQTLQAGETYRADAWPYVPTTSAGRLTVWRDGMMCGRTDAQLFAGYGLYPDWDTNPVTGWFHVGELEYDASGHVTRFAATYEMNCQYLGDPVGFEGSIAVNATTPLAPVPAAPEAPGPVTGLAAVNIGPDGSGDNTTTLTWTNPSGFADVTLDMVQSTEASKLPALVGRHFARLYRGQASSYSERRIEFMDTRTYRVVARGPSGRLGTPSVLTVMGTRLTLPRREKVTIGQELQVTGRLSESWDYVDFADVMNGPGLVGHTVMLCRQSSVNYVDGDCTRVDRTTTGADGYFTLSATPIKNQLYSVLVPATPQMVGNTSRVVNALVAPRTDLKAPESERLSGVVSVRRGAVIHFSTSRARAGARGIVRLQRFDGRRWRTVVTASLASGSGARRLAVFYREQTSGRHAYRIVKPGDAHHATGHSRTVYVRVR